MSNNCITRNSATIVIAAALAWADGGFSAYALTVTSGPFFTPASNAPLAGVLSLTTDENSLVSVSVSDGTGTWTRDFFNCGTNHSETVLGFKASRTNEIAVTVRDRYRNALTIGEPLTFVTGPLPTNLPTFTVHTNNVKLMEPGYTLFLVDNRTQSEAFVTIVDSSGEVVWYSSALPTPSDVRQLADGNLFFPVTGGTGFAEANMLGETVNTWTAPLSVDSHEDLMTDHGTILYLNSNTQAVSNFPSSSGDPSAPKGTADVTCGTVVEMSVTNSALFDSWSLIDMLDPVRVDYLCFEIISLFGIDPEHANAVVDDTSDGSIIVSLRNQDAIVKFSREGGIKWILGPPQNWDPEWQPFLLTPVGTPFEWNYAQHAPVITPQGTLLFYDDGNFRAEPFESFVDDSNNFSRAAEFSVDETNMTVSQVWQFTGTNEDRLFTGALGNATWLPHTSNVLVNFGYITFENGAAIDPIAPAATAVRIKEVTHEANPTVVFDLELSGAKNTATNYAGFDVYRSYRIPDLYVHPANPVQGLTVQLNGATAILQFTADPARKYVVQASSDLVKWRLLSMALSDDADGDFSFQDASGGGKGQFYRVITQ